MSTISRLNYLNVGPGGTFSAGGQYQSTPADVDAIIAHLAARPQKRIVVHFHGGLVPEAAGIAVAEKMIEVYENAGSHSLTVVWETGFIETMRDNLSDVARTKLFRKLLRLVLKLALPHLNPVPGVKGFGPSPTDGEIEAELARATPFDAWDEGEPTPGARAGLLPDEGQLTVQAQALLQNEPPLDPATDVSPQIDVQKVLEPPAVPGERGVITGIKLAWVAGRIAYRILKRMIKKHGHGLYPTTVEEILREILLADFGAVIWGDMKDKASDMFGDHDAAGARAGTYLVEKLAALQTSSPELVVDVVGHSAGSIAAAWMLARAQRSNLKCRRMAYLAPAIRLNLFVQEVLPRYGTSGTFVQFRSYTMDDDFERKDHLVGPVYTRSLLYLIAGILEDDDGDTPLVGLERHIEHVAPYLGGDYATAHNFIYAAGADRLVRSKTSMYAPTAPPALRSESEHHGDFDDTDQATRTALTEYLR